ncbi:hypothetical protein Tco_1407026 [Tanacetum coccineum]
MNMLNSKCTTSFAKPQYLKKVECAKPCLYDIACYRDNLVNMLAPETDETIRLAKESRSKLSDLIKPFDYPKLNNLYKTFVLQREKSAEQIFFQNNLSFDDYPVLELQLQPTLVYMSNNFGKFKQTLKVEMVEDLRDGMLVFRKSVECENLEIELSKSKTQRTDKRFANLEQHCINLELALQHEKEKNVCENSWGKQSLILGNNEKV